MICSYVDILGDGKRHRIKLAVTTDHPASSYGQPVLVMPDGQLLPPSSWLLSAYQVESITPAEFKALKNWLGWLDIATEQPGTSDAAVSAVASALGRQGGSKTSEAKQRAARRNGKKGGRPRKKIP